MSSSTRIALLRGINVGTAKRVAMADLRAVFESLGYGDVRTLLNSGNVVFTAPASLRGDPAPRIERALAEHTGVSARVVSRTAVELGAIVAKNPLARIATDPSRHLVAFVRNPLDLGKLKPLLAPDWGAESLALGPGAAYLWLPRGILQSPLARALDQALGDGVTTRNWATVLKLAALAGAPVRP